MSPAPRRPGRAGAGVGALLALALLALGVRALPLASVFGVDGEVYLGVWDASYHARRAYYSFVNFPSLLFFDRYLAFPDGAPVPLPPLYDWALAAVARATGETTRDFERVAAWASPVLAALCVWPVHAIARAVAGRGAALAAAALFALLPASVAQTELGDCDHHAAVALIGAGLLAASLRVVRAGEGGRAAAQVALALLRAAVVLSWSGSLLYLALADGTLLAAALLAGRRDWLAGQALGALAAALLVAPWVAAAGTPLGGPLASTTLSWLHVLALLGVAAVAAGTALLERARPAGAAVRCARALVLAAALLLGLLALPAARDSLAAGLGFLTKADVWAPANIEQRPLFAWLPGALPVRDPRHAPERLYGYLAYALPLAPLAALALARDARRRVPALCLAAWTLVLGALAVHQVRYGSDFAATAAVGFALLLAAARRLAARRLRPAAATLAVVALAAGLLAPALAVHARALPSALARVLDPEVLTLRDSLTPLHSLVRFGRTLARVTPETAGYVDPLGVPEYGVLCDPRYGHALLWTARRPTPANNLGPYLDAEKYAEVLAFFDETSEADAVATLERLRLRYVVTQAHRELRPGTLVHHLHRLDGSAIPGRAHSEHFRLVTEGPANGRPLWIAFPDGAPEGVVPYKLFERVRGALLEARAAPGDEMTANLRLVTPTGRRFRFRARTRADADGVALLRVPYATRGDSPTRAAGPYRVRIGGLRARVSVSDAQVREGVAIRVEGASPARGGEPAPDQKSGSI